ncbi:unnamed protein product, partial [Medioppia subpectinata]
DGAIKAENIINPLRNTRTCPANGVLNVSVCTMGSPTAISFPHFLYADNNYLQSVDGLTPRPVDHSFYMDFEDHLGVPLNVAARLQVNIVVEKNQNLDFSRNFSDKPLYFPQFWFSTTAAVGDDMIQQLNFLTIHINNRQKYKAVEMNSTHFST